MTERRETRMLVVTGASTGIGRAVALRLAQDGYTVFAGVRQTGVVDELNQLGRQNLHPILLDVSDVDSIERAIATVRERARPGQVLHAVINNAAICVTGPLETLPLARLREQLEVNLLGTMAMTQAALPLLRAARGRVVNIGSNVARLAPPFLGPYAASKAALEALSDCLRRELRGAGVRVSLVVPGPVMTPAWDKIAADQAHWSATAEAVERERYHGAIERFSAMNTSSAKRSRLTSEQVAALVARVLKSPAPRARYEIGMGAYAGTLISRLLPTRWVDNAFHRVMQPSAT